MFYFILFWFTKTELRPGYNEAFLELFSYPPDRRLCVIFVLKEYLSRTEKLCGNCKNLFISYVKPFGPVSRETISRWLKTVMSSSGIVLDHQLFLRLIRMLFQLKKSCKEQVGLTLELLPNITRSPSKWKTNGFIMLFSECK